RGSRVAFRRCAPTPRSTRCSRTPFAGCSTSPSTRGRSTDQRSLGPPTRSTPFEGQRVPMPSWQFEAGERGLVARGQFSNGHTGPPGTVHGGWIAFAFDEILGWANAQAGFPSMTGKLTIRYRRPTPIGALVEFWVANP